MMRYGLRAWGIVGVAAVACVAWQNAAWGVNLDKDGSMRLGVRAYVNARIQAEHTDRTVEFSKANPNAPASNTSPTNLPVKTMESQTFPYSPPGHLRQNRMFIEAEFEHDLTGLMKTFGPLPLLENLPFDIYSLKYKLIYRGEGEGVYNWGPREFRTSDAYRQLLESARWAEPIDQNNLQTEPVYNPPFSCTLQTCPNVPFARQRLRDLATVRNRLFQAYVDVASGPVFLRIGRQNLVWGETDAFRLVYYINPIDSSFGGFLIDLDERRVPIDMLRVNYGLGSHGPFTEAFVEGYAAWDTSVSYYPAISGLPGSAWTFPNFGTPQGVPSGIQRNFVYRPPLNFSSTRGGARLVFNALNATFSLAHYYTYSDLPLAQTCVAPGFPVQKISTARFGSGPIPGCPAPVYDEPVAQPPVCIAPNVPAGCRPAGTFVQLAPTALAVQLPARMQVSGLSSTFAVPSDLVGKAGLTGELIVRSELAYFKDEPAAAQSQLDPFTYLLDSPNPRQTGGTLRRDSINFLLGLDTNQFIRFLNPLNSFFISTQFFYKHIKNAPEDMVLPVPAKYVGSQQPALGAIRPIFVKSYPNQYIQTLFIGTSYAGGRVEPSFTMLYDWSGAVTLIPSLTLVHDPFRFTVQYDYLEASSLKGNSGVSLLRDRDNVLFQFEYVI